MSQNVIPVFGRQNAFNLPPAPEVPYSQAANSNTNYIGDSNGSMIRPAFGRQVQVPQEFRDEDYVASVRPQFGRQSNSRYNDYSGKSGGKRHKKSKRGGSKRKCKKSRKTRRCRK